jgi:hypothetical protein
MQTYHEASVQLRYNATYWLRMVQDYGAVEAAKRLIAGEAVGSDGLTRLWEEGRLDLTVEASMLRPEFAPLFTEAERARTRAILATYGYRAPWDAGPAAPATQEGATQ